jgi:DNA replication protein DnaC
VARRIQDAHFTKVKTLEDFQFEKAPQIPAALIRSLAEGGHLERSEPVIFLGEAGTGKTHLATGLAVAACRQQKRVRFTSVAKLVNELLDAKQRNEANRAVQRWLGYELIVLDELGYVAMPEPAAECLFQVIAGRAEVAADCDHEFTLLGVDHDVSQCSPMQSYGGSAHRPGAHHRDRK